MVLPIQTTTNQVVSPNSLGLGGASQSAAQGAVGAAAAQQAAAAVGAVQSAAQTIVPPRQTVRPTAAGFGVNPTNTEIVQLAINPAVAQAAEIQALATQAALRTPSTAIAATFRPTPQQTVSPSYLGLPSAVKPEVAAETRLLQLTKTPTGGAASVDFGRQQHISTTSELFAVTSGEGQNMRTDNYAGMAVTGNYQSEGGNKIYDVQQLTENNYYSDALGKYITGAGTPYNTGLYSDANGNLYTRTVTTNGNVIFTKTGQTLSQNISGQVAENARAISTSTGLEQGILQQNIRNILSTSAVYAAAGLTPEGTTVSPGSSYPTYGEIARTLLTPAVGESEAERIVQGSAIPITTGALAAYNLASSRNLDTSSLLTKEALGYSSLGNAQVVLPGTITDLNAAVNAVGGTYYGSVPKSESVESAQPESATETVKAPYISRPKGETATYYAPYGSYAQIELPNSRAIIQPEGSIDIYTKTYHGSWIESSSGGRGAVSSGSYTVTKPETPLVYTRAGAALGILAPTANKEEAVNVLASPELYSRLGSEVYGGYVTRLTGATVQSTGAQYGVFSNKYNLANYINPSDVNKTRVELPSIMTPWQIPGTSPSLQLLTSAGYKTLELPQQVGAPITIQVPGQAGTIPVPTKILGTVGVSTADQPSTILNNSLLNILPEGQQIKQFITSGVGPAIVDSSLAIIGMIPGISAPTPGATLMSKLGLSSTAEATAIQKDYTALQSQKSTYDALSNTIDAQRAELNTLTSGKINAEGKFTGTDTEYKQVQELQTNLNKNIDKYNSYQDKLQNIQTQLYASGTLLPTGQIAPESARPYGTFSDWSNSVQKLLTGATPSQFEVYEKSQEFANAPIYTQFGEGLVKTITNPQSALTAGIQAAEFYLGGEAIGIGGRALAGRGAVISGGERGLLTRAADTVIKAYETPIKVFGGVSVGSATVGAGFTGAGIYQAAGGFGEGFKPNVGTAQFVSNLGAFTGSALIMGATLSAPKLADVSFTSMRDFVGKNYESLSDSVFRTQQRIAGFERISGKVESENEYGIRPPDWSIRVSPEIYRTTPKEYYYTGIDLSSFGATVEGESIAKVYATSGRHAGGLKFNLDDRVANIITERGPMTEKQYSDYIAERYVNRLREQQSELGRRYGNPNLLGTFGEQRGVIVPGKGIVSPAVATEMEIRNYENRQVEQSYLNYLKELRATSGQRIGSVGLLGSFEGRTGVIVPGEGVVSPTRANEIEIERYESKRAVTDYTNLLKEQISVLGKRPGNELLLGPPTGEVGVIVPGKGVITASSANELAIARHESNLLAKDYTDFLKTQKIELGMRVGNEKLLGTIQGRQGIIVPGEGLVTSERANQIAISEFEGRRNVEDYKRFLQEQKLYLGKGGSYGLPIPELKLSVKTLKTNEPVVSAATSTALVPRGQYNTLQIGIDRLVDKLDREAEITERYAKLATTQAFKPRATPSGAKTMGNGMVLLTKTKTTPSMKVELIGPTPRIKIEPIGPTPRVKIELVNPSQVGVLTTKSETIPSSVETTAMQRKFLASMPMLAGALIGKQYNINRIERAQQKQQLKTRNITLGNVPLITQKSINETEITPLQSTASITLQTPVITPTQIPTVSTSLIQEQPPLQDIQQKYLQEQQQIKEQIPQEPKLLVPVLAGALQPMFATKKPKHKQPIRAHRELFAYPFDIERANIETSRMLRAGSNLITGTLKPKAKVQPPRVNVPKIVAPKFTDVKFNARLGAYVNVGRAPGTGAAKAPRIVTLNTGLTSSLPKAKKKGKNKK